MIRGAIDFFDTRRVAGWLFSEEIELSGRRVLAFLGKACIGAGEVGLFRQDLADAGLGTGECGFDFDVTIPASLQNSREDITVKIEHSDLSLKSNVSLALSKPADTASPDVAFSDGRLQWLVDSGFMSKPRANLVRRLMMLGYYQFATSCSGGDITAECKEMAADELTILSQQILTIETRRAVPTEVATSIRKMSDGAQHPFVAIYAPGMALSFVEGSHRVPEGAGDSAARISVNMNEWTMLVLDGRINVEAAGETEALLMIGRPKDG